MVETGWRRVKSEMIVSDSIQNNRFSKGSTPKDLANSFTPFEPADNATCNTSAALLRNVVRGCASYSRVTRMGRDEKGLRTASRICSLERETTDRDPDSVSSPQIKPT